MSDKKHLVLQSAKESRNSGVFVILGRILHHILHLISTQILITTLPSTHDVVVDSGNASAAKH